jgi:hypothetical protein
VQDTNFLERLSVVTALFTRSRDFLLVVQRFEKRFVHLHGARPEKVAAEKHGFAGIYLDVAILLGFSALAIGACIALFERQI